MAQPNPPQLLESLARDLARHGLPPAVVLHGPEDHFRSEGLRAVLAAAGEGDVIQLDAASPPEALAGLGADLATPSLFGGRKVVVLREDLAWSGRRSQLEDQLLAFLARPAGGTCVVALRREKLAAGSRLLKALAAAGGVELACRELYATPYPGRKPWESELCSWILVQARRRGLHLDPEGVLLLVAVLGCSAGELAGFLERLAGHPGAAGRRPIPRDLLQELLGPGGESSQFELAEALLQGDLAGALTRVRAISAAGLKDREGRPLDPRAAVVPTLAWLHQAAVRCYAAHLRLGRGEARRAVAEELGIRWFPERFWAQVEASPPDRLNRILRALLRAQRRLRRDGEEPDRVLDLLVLEALHP